VLEARIWFYDRKRGKLMSLDLELIGVNASEFNELNEDVCGEMTSLGDFRFHCRETRVDYNEHMIDNFIRDTSTAIHVNHASSECTLKSNSRFPSGSMSLILCFR
jgi:hypothetical protein